MENIKNIDVPLLTEQYVPSNEELTLFIETTAYLGCDDDGAYS